MTDNGVGARPMTQPEQPREALAALLRRYVNIDPAGDAHAAFADRLIAAGVRLGVPAPASSAGLDGLRAGLRAAIVALPQPTLGLAGGVNRGAAIDAIDRVFAALAPSTEEPRACPGCKHPQPDPHVEREGGSWCVADMDAANAAGDDPRSVGPCR